MSNFSNSFTSFNTYNCYNGQRLSNYQRFRNRFPEKSGQDKQSKCYKGIFINLYRDHGHLTIVTTDSKQVITIFPFLGLVDLPYSIKGTPVPGYHVHEGKHFRVQQQDCRGECIWLHLSDLDLPDDVEACFNSPNIMTVIFFQEGQELKQVVWSRAPESSYVRFCSKFKQDHLQSIEGGGTRRRFQYFLSGTFGALFQTHNSFLLLPQDLDQESKDLYTDGIILESCKGKVPHVRMNPKQKDIKVLGDSLPEFRKYQGKYFELYRQSDQEDFAILHILISGWLQSDQPRKNFNNPNVDTFVFQVARKPQHHIRNPHSFEAWITPRNKIVLIKEFCNSGQRKATKRWRHKQKKKKKKNPKKPEERERKQRTRECRI